MATSYPRFKVDTKKYLLKKYKDKDFSVLDVGAGQGVYGSLLRAYAAKIDAVEIFERNIDFYDLHDIYDNVFLSDILDFNFEYYDVIIMGDVLEHIPTEKAIPLIKKLYKKCDELIIAIPYQLVQEPYDENIYEKHWQDDITNEIFNQRYPGFTRLFYDDVVGIYIKDQSYAPDYKICVYTIAKNESVNVDKWADSMGEADYMCVLDTGSSDDTVEKLKTRGVIVDQKIITPWRFDVARNESMKLIPADTDICVSTDLDEVFEPGWAKTLRSKWKPGMKMMRYYYVFVHSPSGGEDDVFFRDKIHANHPMFKWIFPIHEVLDRPKNMPEALIPEIRCHHWQNKETKRGVYLTLMQQEYNENPTNMRNLFLLAREYYIVKDFPNAIKYLEEFVKVGPIEMTNEKIFSLSLVGYAQLELKNLYDSKMAFTRSVLINKKVFRMPILGLALCSLYENNPMEALKYIKETLSITKRFYIFSDEGAAWEEKPHLFAFQAYAALGDFDNALKAINNVLVYKKDQYYFDLREALLKQMQKVKEEKTNGGKNV